MTRRLVHLIWEKPSVHNWKLTMLRLAVRGEQIAIVIEEAPPSYLPQRPNL